jgi:hypothetical protein
MSRASPLSPSTNDITAIPAAAPLSGSMIEMLRATKMGLSCEDIGISLKCKAVRGSIMDEAEDLKRQQEVSWPWRDAAHARGRETHSMIALQIIVNPWKTTPAVSKVCGC